MTGYEANAIAHTNKVTGPRYAGRSAHTMARSRLAAFIQARRSMIRRFRGRADVTKWLGQLCGGYLNITISGLRTGKDSRSDIRLGSREDSLGPRSDATACYRFCLGQRVEEGLRRSIG